MVSRPLSRLSRKCVALLACALVMTCGVRLATAEYQFEDNVRDLLASAKELSAKNALEEAAIEYENVLAIDPLHREAALGAIDMYLKMGAVVAAEDLMTRLPRMGADPAKVAGLRTQLDGVKAHPPAKRAYVFVAAPAPTALDSSLIPGVPKAGAAATPGAVAAAPVAGGAGGVKTAAPKGGELDDDILDGPGPGASPAPGAAPAAGAKVPAPAPSPGASPKADIDDLGL